MLRPSRGAKKSFIDRLSGQIAAPDRIVYDVEALVQRNSSIDANKATLKMEIKRLKQEIVQAAEDSERAAA